VSDGPGIITGTPCSSDHETLDEEFNSLGKEAPLAPQRSETHLVPGLSALALSTDLTTASGTDNARRPRPEGTNPYPHFASGTKSGHGPSKAHESKLGTAEHSALVNQPQGCIQSTRAAAEQRPLSEPGFDNSEAHAHLEANGTSSVYSEVNNLGVSFIDGYVATFAEVLSKTILCYGPGHEAQERIYESLPRMITALSLALALRYIAEPTGRLWFLFINTAGTL
jgi:hypothetical protein